jgi:hypothetical protein
MEEMTRVTLPEGTLMVNIPSELVETVVLEFFTLTVAPATGPLPASSVTFPVTVLSCENAMHQHRQAETKSSSF